MASIIIPRANDSMTFSFFTCPYLIGLNYSALASASSCSHWAYLTFPCHLCLSKVCVTLEEVYILVAPLDTWSMDEMERQRRARYQKFRGESSVLPMKGVVPIYSTNLDVQYPTVGVASCVRVPLQRPRCARKLHRGSQSRVLDEDSLK